RLRTGGGERDGCVACGPLHSAHRRCVAEVARNVRRRRVQRAPEKTRPAYHQGRHGPPSARRGVGPPRMCPGTVQTWERAGSQRLLLSSQALVKMFSGSEARSTSCITMVVLLPFSTSSKMRISLGK